ncbi:S-adenosyl-L-methionine-dependent methyltransferase [Phycomyces nitens]|nr:S-adenosyl-L-methionine-dependent methyltransferase [Phycomyces nitens]
MRRQRYRIYNIVYTHIKTQKFILAKILPLFQLLLLLLFENMKAVHKTAANGFKPAAGSYAKTRPHYPKALIDQVLKIVPRGSNVVDLAAGTGIMTQSLVDAGYKVTPVEPVSDMREQLEKQVGIPALEGTSWKIPVKDESQDMVMVAQAFHWFDDIETLREIHRVVKPGGIFALTWNMESKERSEWVADIRKIYEAYDEAAPQYRKGRWRKVFETEEAKKLFELPLHELTFSNDFNVPTNHVFERVLTKSYIAILSDEEKAKLRQDIQAKLIPEKGFVPKDGKILYPHDTDLAWCVGKK